MNAAERRATVERWAAALGHQTIFWPDLDGALIGAETKTGRAVYGWREMIQTLQEADAVDGEWPDEEEVIDHLTYNTLGSWLGEMTPGVLYQPGEGPGTLAVDPRRVIRVEAM